MLLRYTYFRKLATTLLISNLEAHYQLKLLQQAQIRVNTDLAALAQVLAWFEQFNHAMVPHSIWLQCQLALAEGFTNAVRHAHRYKPTETPIEIEVMLLDNALELRIWDYGSIYNLNQQIENMSPEMDKDAEGGRGLKLMKRMADVLTYTRIDNQRNCLLIVKHYSKE
jgi:serine/threonine-protein kinase RsbW